MTAITVDLDVTEVDMSGICVDVYGADHRILFDNAVVILTENQLVELQKQITNYLNDL